MSKRKTITLITESTGSADALRIVDTIAGTQIARIDSKIYYPYYRFSANCSARTLFGSKPISTSCLIDACHGIGATSDPITVHATSVPTDDILEVRNGATEARKAAHRFLTHNLGRRLRTIGHFNVELEAQGLVYKAFWLVRCGHTVVMVDSFSGCLHTLGKRAA